MFRRFIPKSVEDITPEWLSRVLTENGVIKNSTVRGVRSEPLGEEQGYMGILARLFIEYDQPEETAPATMIVKIPTRELKNRMTGELFLNYERENRMYEEFLGNLPLRTPRCYYSDMDKGMGQRTANLSYALYEKPPKGFLGLWLGLFMLIAILLRRRYILLLEDFQNLDYVDQRDGCTFEQAKQVMKPWGLAQAVYWENPEVEKYWLKPHSEMSNLMGLLYERGLPVIKRNFGEKLSEKENEVFDWIAENNKEMNEHIRTRPTTLVHSDYRIDNIFFDREKDEIAVIDWQTCYQGLGVADPAYFCLSGGNCAFSLEQVEELITIYHSGLVEGGVSNYSLEECLADFKYGLLVAIRYVMIILGALEIDKDQNAQLLVSLWLDRMKPLIEGIDLSTLLKSA